jgi:NAD(P)-dependent dehydrogenase (short-subunit alcohol dehydrogenase family)
MVRGDLLDMTPESFDRCMAVNLRGAFFLVQEVRAPDAAPAPAPYRSIHVVTSVSAEIVSPDRAEYCISKAGASMMTQALAARLAPEGIGVFETPPRHHPHADDRTRRASATTPASRAASCPPPAGASRPTSGASPCRSRAGTSPSRPAPSIPVDGGLSIHRL